MGNDSKMPSFDLRVFIVLGGVFGLWILFLIYHELLVPLIKQKLFPKEEEIEKNSHYR